jgi:hypothetical protein
MALGLGFGISPNLGVELDQLLGGYIAQQFYQACHIGCLDISTGCGGYLGFLGLVM